MGHDAILEPDKEHCIPLKTFRGMDRRQNNTLFACGRLAARVCSLDEMQSALRPIIEKVWRYCEDNHVRGRTVTLKVKFSDFHQITRSRTLPSYVESQGEVEQAAFDLLQATFPLDKRVRLLGVSLSALNTEDEPGSPAFP